MFSLLSKYDGFPLDEPAISIPRSVLKLYARLKEAGVSHHTVTDDYFIFCGKLRHYAAPVMIGIHHNMMLLEFIEIFHTKEYYQSPDYDIYRSYRDFSRALCEEYGPSTPRVIPGDFPSEVWHRRGLRIDHYIMDRFGPEEHLHIHLTLGKVG